MAAEQIESIILQLASQLQAGKRFLVTAESCTGGLISTYLTQVAGSSRWFDRAYVTYSNEAKQEMLGVNPKTLAEHGAVSKETACEMAKGALLTNKPSISVSVTGVAGPDGGTVDTPVGTVWIGWCLHKNEPEAKRFLFTGNREAIREQTVQAALQGVLQRLEV